MGVRTSGQMGSADRRPWKMDERLKSENMQKKSSFLNGVGWGERRYLFYFTYLLNTHSVQHMGTNMQ